MSQHRAVDRSHGLLAGGLIALFGLLSFYAWQVENARWEVTFMRWLQDAPLPLLRPVSISLAVAGHGIPWIAIIAAIGLSLWLLGGLRLVLLLALTASMQDVGALVKLVIERARPHDSSIQVWHQINSYSFPSGHTLGATLVFGFLFFAVEHCQVSPAVRRVLQALSLTWILLMGISRMELGAHWPTDILGAYAIGGLMLLPVVLILRRTSPLMPVPITADHSAD